MTNKNGLVQDQNSPYQAKGEPPAEPVPLPKGKEEPDSLLVQPSHVGRKVVLGFLTIALLVIIYLAYQILRPFIAIFIVAAATATLSYPIYEHITRRLGGRSTLGATITLLMLILVVVIPIILYSSILSREAVNLTKGLNASTIQEYVSKAAERFLPERFDLTSFIDKRLGPEGILGSSYFKEAVNRVAGAANKLVQGFVTGAATALINFLIFFLFFFFLLRDGRALGEELMRLSPLEDSAEREIFNHLTKTIRAILMGGVLVPIVQGILAMVGFAIFGLPSPILWGSLVIVGSVIPIVGSSVIWIPATIYLALTATTWKWVGLLIYCILIISTSDNFLKPIILKETANFHPLIAFISVLGGMAAFGVFGFILGPIIASLLLSLIRIYKYEILRLPAEDSRTG